jgi:hypothetical protein
MIQAAKMLLRCLAPTGLIGCVVSTDNKQIYIVLYMMSGSAYNYLEYGVFSFAIPEGYPPPLKIMFKLLFLLCYNRNSISHYRTYRGGWSRH